MIKTLVKLATVASLVGAIAIVSLSTERVEALTEAQVLERLNGIPVFVLTDDKGTPLLGSLPNNTSNNGATQVLLFFLNPEDAQKVLTQVRATNPTVGDKAKIIVRSMNDAYKVIKTNTDKKIAFQIVPAKASIESARNIFIAQGKPVDNLPNVPVFFAIGGKDKEQGLLTLEQNGKKFVPFFFDQGDLQGLINRAEQKQPDVVNGTEIQVTSLFQVLDSMVTKNNKPNPEAEKFTFVPSRVALNYVTKNQSQVDKQSTYQTSSFKYDQASLFNDSALVSSGNEPDLVNLKAGEVARRLGQYREAISYYDKALEINPKLAFAWYRRGYVLDILKRYSDALSAFARVSQLLNNSTWDSSPWHGRGVTLIKMQRYQEAIASFEKAIAIGRYELPQNEKDLVPADSWYGKGLALYNLKRYREALRAFDKALELQPGHPEATQGRATALEALGQ